MADNIDPNNILAKAIATHLREKGLILEENAETIASYLAEGRMKDTDK